MTKKNKKFDPDQEISSENQPEGDFPEITEEEIIEGEKLAEKELVEGVSVDNPKVPDLSKAPEPQPNPPVVITEDPAKVTGETKEEKIFDIEKERDTRTMEKPAEEEKDPAKTGPFNPTTGEPLTPEGAPLPKNKDDVPTGTQDSVPSENAKLP